MLYEIAGQARNDSDWGLLAPFVVDWDYVVFIISKYGKSRLNKDCKHS